MKTFFFLILTIGGLLILSPVFSQPTAEKLAEGPGAVLVQGKCALCHDLGHIIRIRQSKEDWEDTLKTMINRGAIVSPEEAALIIDYLTKYYGK
jgi:hypothetical protein